MMPRERLLDFVIIILALAIVFILFLKFNPLEKKNKFSVSIDNIESVKVMDLHSESIKLIDAMNSSEETFCMIFELTNCFSCILKGLEDIKNLRTNGNESIIILVHDNFEDFKGWTISKNINFAYLMKKSDFYNHLNIPTLPAILKFKENKLRSFRFITP